MGLDQYAYAAPNELVGDQQVDLDLFDDGKAKQEVDTNFFYWRKFNALHGWMEDLYRAKGGTGEVFNCNTVRLMPEDINALESAQLTPREGFFFGSQTIHPQDMEDLQKFIEKSRQAFNDGLAVIYDSWW